MALVEGSAPHLSAETRDLLRNRLRIAAVMFFVGFSAFFIRWFFYWNEWNLREQLPLIFYTHGLVTAVLGIFAVRLCTHCSYSLTKLRISELVLFGCPALFFLVSGLQETTYLAKLPEGSARLNFIVTPWVLLVFTYAMFIPNTWRRAAAVVGFMGAIPIAMLAYFYTMPAFTRLVERPEYRGFVSTQVLIIPIVILTAVVGVHTIGTLRREAFAAKQLGQYRLKRRIGSGGMGEVYLAEHQMMKRPCAVKLIRPEKAGDPRMLARFEREVRATAKLSHWNSIDIYDFGRTADGTFYYVMEYLPGHNIGEIVERIRPDPARPIGVFDGAGVCRPGRSTRHRPRPPRHQTGEYLLRLPRRRVRCREAARLRPRETHAGKKPGCPANARRHRDRLAAVHVARAGQRRRDGRRPQRYLLAGRGAVLHAHRPAAVHVR